MKQISATLKLRPKDTWCKLKLKKTKSPYNSVQMSHSMSILNWRLVSFTFKIGNIKDYSKSYIKYLTTHYAIYYWQDSLQLIHNKAMTSNKRCDKIKEYLMWLTTQMKLKINAPNITSPTGHGSNVL